MNLKKYYIFALTLLFAIGILAGCQRQSDGQGSVSEPNNQNASEEQIVIDTVHTSEISIDWAGTYHGITPSANTAGIQVQLILEMDGTDTNGFFTLTYEHLESNYVPEIGQFRWSERAGGQSGRFSWNESGNIIRLDIQDWPLYYFVGQGMLIQLDMDGNEITGPLADYYFLTKVESMPHYPIDGEELIITGHTAENSLDWAGTYQGITPAASSMGIQIQLTLQFDGMFMLSFEYLEGDYVPEIGQFQWSDRAHGVYYGSFTWNESGNIIRLDIQDWPPYYFVGEGMLIQLDMEGNEITGALADYYILTKVELPLH